MRRMRRRGSGDLDEDGLVIEYQDSCDVVLEREASNLRTDFAGDLHANLSNSRLPCALDPCGKLDPSGISQWLPTRFDFLDSRDVARMMAVWRVKLDIRGRGSGFRTTP
jgi:hypothetical protein